MKKLKIYLFSVIFIFVLMLTTKVNAVGTVSLSASKSTVTVGDEFSISVNLNGASSATLTVRVSVDTSKVDYISGPSNSSFSNGRAIYTWTDPTGGDNPKTGTIVTFKFKAKQAGKASFSVNGDFYSSDETNINPSFSGTSVTIQEKVVTPPSNEGNTGGNAGENSGGNNQGGTGGSNQGGNSSGGNSKPSTLSSNANLKELHLNVEGLSPAFNKNTTNYNITVQDIDNINVNAIPEDSKAKVVVTGNTGLKIGTNNILIKVTAEDGKTTKTYKINTTKTNNPDLANAFLENLAIENITLNPEFNKDIYDYNVELLEDVSTLNILAIPQIEGASVNIEGNENLILGENKVTITVTARDEITVKQYIINVNKKEIEKESVEAELNDINEESIAGMQNSKNIVYVIVIIVILAMMGIGAIIFVLIKKYKK